jgi:dimethylhistidine N-methyltransferase
MEQQLALSALAVDTDKGLTAKQKFLLPKYFYDDEGSSIFQQIMQMPEYYLTDCELEIFRDQHEQIVGTFLKDSLQFELIELGSGDGSKTKVLLDSLVGRAINFKYVPVDISRKANDELVESLAQQMPSLKVDPQTGDFFNVMQSINGHSSIRKIILFLGSNIGNFTDERLSLFLGHLSQFAQVGDKAMIGFDLKKSPQIVTKAYNDPHGHTRRFNLNHLARLNRELGADFDLTNFEHHTDYNPQTGEMKSFLVSKIEQSIHIQALNKSYNLKKWEPIFMELSRKFDLETIEKLASNHGFRVEANFTDSRGYFTDSVWVKEK